ncbi:hypothetical protein CBR_g34354 [Chara braunii]|uniref:DUF659 domain-containing protein n=1 Tax=Chara braunii TaxID=69332 RepID=A0A388LIB5_CHABU|nr:hypothetical protein CBR_g34354 [Chara braunii]|eukprot:GBG82074.1 hypothetical protein CBR_g34354 [Chara braunii]
MADTSHGSFGRSWVEKGVVRLRDLWLEIEGRWISGRELRSELPGCWGVEDKLQAILNALPEEWSWLLSPEGVNPPGTWYEVQKTAEARRFLKLVELRPEGGRVFQSWRLQINTEDMRLEKEEESSQLSQGTTPVGPLTEIRVREVCSDNGEWKVVLWNEGTPVAQLTADPKQWAWRGRGKQGTDLSFADYDLKVGEEEDELAGGMAESDGAVDLQLGVGCSGWHDGCEGNDDLDEGARDIVRDVLDEMEEREEVELPGEEVVMTSRKEDPEIRKGKNPMGETDQAATRPGKRVRQSKIDKVDTADKQSIFNDKFLQWIYDSGIPFNAFRRQSRRVVRKETGAIVFRRWKAIIESFPGKDVIAFCTDSASNYTMTARLLAADPDPVVRRITWLLFSTHVCNLMLSDIGTRVGWAVDTIIRGRAMMRFIKSHGAALALYKKKSPRVPLVQQVETRFASVFMMLTCLLGIRDSLEAMLHDDAWRVSRGSEDCYPRRDACTGGDPTSRDYLVVRDQMRRFHARSRDQGDRLVSDAEAEGCHGDQETHHCAAWWFVHGTAHHELRAIGIRVMHMWSLSMRAVETGVTGWCRMPRQRVAMGIRRLTIARREDVAGGTDRTTEHVYFTYGGGSDGHAPRTPVITDDVTGGAHGSATRHPPAGRGRGAVARNVHPRARRVLGLESSDEDEGVAPHADCLRDPRFDPSHHSREHSEQLRRSHRLAERSISASQQPQNIPVAEGTPSHSGPAQAATSSLHTSNFDIAGLHGGSPVLRCRVHDRADYSTDVREREETVEERDARLDREEEARLQSMPRWEGGEAYEAEQRRQRELKTIGAGPPSSVGRMPTSDRMQPPSGPSHVVGGGADTCGLDAGGEGQADVPCEGGHVGGVETVGADIGEESSDDGEECAAAEAIVGDVVIGICAAGTDGGTHGGEEGMVDEGSVPLPQEELVDEGSVPLPQEELDEGDLALPEEELLDEDSVPWEGSVPFDAFVDGATEDDEEGAAVDAGHSAPSVRDGVTGGHVEEEGAAIDMSVAIIVRPLSVRDVERGGHIDSGGRILVYKETTGSFSTGGQLGEMPQWDGGEPGECTPTPLHPEQLERLGTEDPFPFAGGQPSPPPWAPVSPRWTGSLQSNIRERESLEIQAAVFSGGPGSSRAQPLTHPVSRASQQGSAPAAGLPPIGGRGSGRGSSWSHRGGVLGGWSSCRHWLASVSGLL